MPRVRSIAEIESELAAKRKELARLEERRDRKANELASLNRQIVLLGGKAVQPPSSGERSGALRPGGRTIDKTLVEYIKDVLSKSPKGMRVKEIVSAVRRAGYTTFSRDFYNIVAATDRGKDFRKVSRGVYALRQKPGRV